jgi:hypothetical protein
MSASMSVSENRLRGLGRTIFTAALDSSDVSGLVVPVKSLGPKMVQPGFRASATSHSSFNKQRPVHAECGAGWPEYDFLSVRRIEPAKHHR